MTALTDPVPAPNPKRGAAAGNANGWEDTDAAELDDLRDFFDNAAIGLHWVDRDGLVTRVNRAELELLGYTSDEYLGHHIGEFHEDETIAGDILTRLASGEILHNYEARMRAKDGSTK